jgi:S-adenosylhomocysteine hydrolase
VKRLLASHPDLILDNGADLIAATVDCAAPRVTAATEETTSGRNRLLGELAGRIPFPVVVINDSPIKLLFENEHGNGHAVRLLAGGQMLNLAAATGHQMQIMDLGFGLQAHSLRELALRPELFSPGYQPVPQEIDRAVAAAGLSTLSSVELG